MKFHPIADIFPLLEGEEFDSLVEDIHREGLREPITLYEDKIIDGRNRYRACQKANVEPKYKNLNKDTSPLAYVISANLKRRHLTPSQRATLGVEILPMLEAEAKKRLQQSGQETGRGHKKVTEKLPEPLGESREQAANMVGVSAHYV